MQPSKFQEDIYLQTLRTFTSFQVEAVAGSGKTTTALGALSRTSSAQQSIFVAFNKSIVEELSSKIPPHATARTLNSLGFSILRSQLNSKMDFKKSSRHLEKFGMKYGDPSFFDGKKLISQAKSAGWGLDTLPDGMAFLQLAHDYDLLLAADDPARAADVIAKAYLSSLEDTKAMDFDDQLIQPFYHHLGFPSYDNILVDEAQDLSPLQHKFVAQMRSDIGRVIAFGDTHQAIYAFRGADSSSMATMKDYFLMSTLPLSICYRCDGLILDEARKLVPHIQTRPNAPEGKVTRVGEYPWHLLPEDAMILCRNNAPLWGLAFACMRQRVPFQMNANAGGAILSFLKGFQNKDLQVLQKRLDNWYSEKQEDCSPMAMEAVNDKYSVCCMLIEESSDYSDLEKIVKKISSYTYGPRLSTIHKAKGLETHTVILYRPGLLPSKFARDPEQIQQEDNLKYVAITRAQEHLILTDIIHFEKEV